MPRPCKRFGIEDARGVLVSSPWSRALVPKMRYGPVQFPPVKRDLAVALDEAVSIQPSLMLSPAPACCSLTSNCSTFSAAKRSGQARKAWHST